MNIWYQFDSTANHVTHHDFHNIDQILINYVCCNEIVSLSIWDEAVPKELPFILLVSFYCTSYTTVFPTDNHKILPNAQSAVFKYIEVRKNGQHFVEDT